MSSTVNSICIVRLSALGDVTHMLPVIHTLKTHSPEIKITWVIGKVEHQLLAPLPGVEFIIFNKKNGIKEYHKIRKQLNNRSFDVLLLMQLSLRANLLSWVIRAKRKIGYDKIRAKYFHGLFIKERIAATPKQHVLDSFMSFLDKLGISKKEYKWHLPPVPGAQDLAQQNINPEKPCLIISPCSSHELRNWHAKGYAAVADHAVKQHGMQVIICGGPSPAEHRMADEIIRLCRVAIPINLVGRDTFAKFIELLRRATVLITPDSGPMHMAAITDTPVIGLHAASNPLRSGPYKSLEWCVNMYDQASQKYLGKPADDIRWGTKIERQGVMDLVEIDHVTDKLDRLMIKIKAKEL
ncbi:MAG: glycosyltransferase family 9 protein [Deltaproteobacteria bacterium]|nr:glycosyltransferase family 9 protein [Deltaproteobacteria bacterium]